MQPLDTSATCCQPSEMTVPAKSEDAEEANDSQTINITNDNDMSVPNLEAHKQIPPDSTCSENDKKSVEIEEPDPKDEYLEESINCSPSSPSEHRDCIDSTTTFTNNENSGEMWSSSTPEFMETPGSDPADGEIYHENFSQVPSAPPLPLVIPAYVYDFGFGHNIVTGPIPGGQFYQPNISPSPPLQLNGQMYFDIGLGHQHHQPMMPQNHHQHPVPPLPTESQRFVPSPQYLQEPQTQGQENHQSHDTLHFLRRNSQYPLQLQDQTQIPTWQELYPNSENSSSDSFGDASSPRLVEYVGDQYHDKNPHTRRTIILNPKRSSKNDPVVFYRFYQFSCPCLGKVWFSPLHRARDGCFCRDCHRFVKPFGHIDGLTPYMGHELCYAKFECHVCGRSWSCQKSRSNFPDNCFSCGTIVYPYYQVSHSVLRRKINRQTERSTIRFRNHTFSESSSVSLDDYVDANDSEEFEFEHEHEHFPSLQQQGQRGMSKVCSAITIVNSNLHPAIGDNDHVDENHKKRKVGTSISDPGVQFGNPRWIKQDKYAFRNHRK